MSDSTTSTEDVEMNEYLDEEAEETQNVVGVEQHGISSISSDSSSSDESSEDHDIKIIGAMMPQMMTAYNMILNGYKYRQSRLLGVPGGSYSGSRRSVSTFGTGYIHMVLNDDPEHFREEFRMYPDCFRKLCRLIREKGILEDTQVIDVEEMVGLFLLVVGQNHRYPTLRRIFRRSHFAVSQNFSRGLHAILQLTQDWMAKPSQGVQSRIWGSTKFFPYFKDCIGSIDGTHIPAKVCGRDTSRYRNRHGVFSQNVLAACNFDLEFIFVLAGWEGSAHDSKILRSALSKGDAVAVPQGQFYLVDCGAL